MNLSLTTRWNASRHEDGAAMIDEIVALGFDRVELGYDTRLDLVPGIRKRVEKGAVKVTSVHNFCPVPAGFPGHPELFSLAALDDRRRQLAVRYTTQSIDFASQMGAKAVVTHAGNVAMKPLTRKLVALTESGRQASAKYEKLKLKLQLRRDKLAPKHMDQLRRSLDELAEPATRLGVCVAFENLPTWEALPTEVEMSGLLDAYPPEVLMVWHDIGHGRIRDNLGLTSSLHWLERLKERLVGCHVHDVLPPAYDHLMPPNGEVDFSAYRDVTSAAIRVLEPPPGVPSASLQGAVEHLGSVWDCETP